MFVLVFQHEEWLLGDEPLHLKFWAKLTLFEQKRQFSIDIRSYCLSCNTSEKSSIITIESPLRAFQCS